MKKNKRNLVVELIKTVSFFVVVGVLLFYIILEIFIPRQTIDIVQFKPYIVITQSMEPVINVDDVAIVKNVDINDLKEEDIITFYADINYDGDKEVVTHYVYSIGEDGNGETTIRTRRYFEDEADIIADTWRLSEDDIIGRYLFKIPMIGIPIRFIQSPFGIAAIIVNAGVIFGIVWLIKKDKKLKDSETVQDDPKNNT